MGGNPGAGRIKPARAETSSGNGRRGWTMDPLGLVRAPLDLPEMYEVRQEFEAPTVGDMAAEVGCRLEKVGTADRLRPGMRIAVTAGSRGIRNIVTILRTVVDWLKSHGADPFVIGAMGSHGGGTAVGQKDLLASLGVTEDSMGCPVLTGDRVSLVGVTARGHKVYCDSLAYESDGIILVNRVKPHTSFRGPIESGVTKMMAVGLGKAPGATYVHMLGPKGMTEAIPSMGEVFIASGKVLAAIAVLENAFDETAELVGLAPADILAREPTLLKRAKEMMPSLPADAVDVLVVGEMGKNYSGTGMDTNILGRYRLESLPDPEAPRVERVVVLDLSEESHGNATGVGLADVVTTRLAGKIDRKPTYLNVLTSTFLGRGAVPPAMDNDWAAIGLAVMSLGRATTEGLKLMMIKNTLNLGAVYISASLLDDLGKRPWARVVGGPVRVEFDRDFSLSGPPVRSH